MFPVSERVEGTCMQFYMPLVLNVLELDTEPRSETMEYAITLYMKFKGTAHSLKLLNFESLHIYVQQDAGLRQTILRI